MMFVENYYYWNNLYLLDIFDYNSDLCIRTTIIIINNLSLLHWLIIMNNYYLVMVDYNYYYYLDHQYRGSVVFDLSLYRL